MEPLKFATLHECLNDFQKRFNDHARVKKLIINWNRAILVEAPDSAAVATMVIENLMMTALKNEANPSHENSIHLQASESTLIRIFSGQYNPSHAVLEGDLAVFASEKDKVKLEAIAVVIWGL
jgi:hypothetical protein